MTATAQDRQAPRYLDVADRIWPILRRGAGAHTFLYRKTGGRIGHVIPGVRGRMLLLDRNWTTVKQRPRPGKCVSEDTTITLYAVKDGER